MKINVQEILESRAGVTQSNHAGAIGVNLPVDAPSTTQLFTSTLMASTTGDFLFRVGTGAMDPKAHTMLLSQYAANTGSVFSTLKLEYTAILAGLGQSNSTYLKIVTAIVGSADRTVQTNRVPTVPPKYVLEVVKRVMELDRDIYYHLVTDYICHQLTALGWILSDAPYVFRLQKHAAFPTYQALVDAYAASNLLKILSTLAAADMTLIKNMAASKSAVQPAMVAMHLANTTQVAHTLSRGEYEPESVVRSVLTTLIRLWSPTTPDELVPTSRVQKSAHVPVLLSNLAIFLAAQEMTGRSGLDQSVDFSDEEMATVILPEFMDALSTLSPFKTRALSDVVAYFGKRSVRDADQTPTQILLYENWSYSSAIEAFNPVKVASGSKGERYLVPEVAISSSLVAGMQPMEGLLNIPALVDRRFNSFSAVPITKRMPITGTALYIGMPSLLEAEVAHATEIGQIQDAISSTEFVKIGDVDSFDEKEWGRIQYDYYATMMHLAVAHSTAVSVSVLEDAINPVCFLVFMQNTAIIRPVGQSAIVSGVVYTTEPLEAVCYAEDFTPTSAFAAKDLSLHEFDQGVHLWDWRAASLPLKMEARYTTTIHNRQYEATVFENQILGSGIRRDNVRFMRPTVAVAIAKLWTQWLRDDDTFVVDHIAGTADPLTQEAFKGRRAQNSLELVLQLKRLGSTGAAARITNRVQRALNQSMYAEGNLDDYAQVIVGVQRHKLDVWAGLVLLRMFGLMTESEVENISNRLNASDAMTYLLASTLE